MKKWVHALNHTEFEHMKRVKDYILWVYVMLIIILPFGLRAVDAQEPASARTADIKTMIGAYRTALGHYWSAEYEAAEAGF